MNEKKTDKYRYMPMYLVKDLETGTVFKSEFLHWSIIPWFVVNMDDEQVIQSFYQYFATQKQFDIIVGRESEFKHGRKIPINLIEPTPEVLELHNLALQWFGDLAARWAVRNPHVGIEYTPHVRRRGGHNLSEEDVLRVSRLSLIRARRQEDGVRTVAARVELDEKA